MTTEALARADRTGLYNPVEGGPNSTFQLGVMEDGGARRRAARHNPSNPLADGRISSNGNAQQRAAAATRSQYDYYQNTFVPVENELIDFVKKGPEGFASEAGQMAASQFNAAHKGATDRNIRRAGLSLTAEERAALDRRTSLARATAVGGAKNTTRRGFDELQTQLTGQLSQLGHQQANQALGGLSNAAGLAQSRDQANRAAQQSWTMGLISTGIGLAAFV